MSRRHWPAHLAGFILNLALTTILWSQHNTTVHISATQDQDLKLRIEHNASALLTGLNHAFFQRRNPEFDKDILTKSAEKYLKRLWEEQIFYCTTTEIERNLIERMDGNYEVRGIPFNVLTDRNTYNQEEGVLILTRAGIIDDVYFGLETEQYNKFLKDGLPVLEVRRRNVILDFVENYRTAYNRKDIQYIKDVFSDGAIIIVGRAIEEPKEANSSMLRGLGEKQVELIRLNKLQYINRLKKVFQSNEVIKVGFDNIEVSQHQDHSEIYGVKLLQNWVSSNYSDQGYLFLMIDFQNESKPIIWVRTWQPKEFTSEDEAIDFGIIKIIK
jgi:hypothetical protein